MIPRSLPPVHSPVTIDALMAGWRALPVGSNRLPALQSHLLARYGARDILLTDSGTSALALALRIGGQGGRPVALPGWSCYDLATAADAADAQVVLYDLDPATLGPDWDSLDRALALGVGAVVLVHPFGLPVDLPEASRRAAKVGALIIEDAAQAVGSCIAGRPAGASGGLGVLSFGRGKGWTSGGGGALLLNPSAPTHLALPAADELGPAGGGVGAIVKLTAQWLLARPQLYALPAALPFLGLGQTIYHRPSPPAGMSGVAAAILRVTESVQEPETNRRRAHAARLRQAVHDSGAGMVPAGWAGGKPGWLRLPVLPTDGMLERANSAAARRLGIMPSYPMSLASLPGFASRIRGGPRSLPGADLLANRLRTLPTHGQLRSGDLTRLEAWLAHK